MYAIKTQTLRRHVVISMFILTTIISGCGRPSRPTIYILTTSSYTETRKWIVQWGEDSNGQILFAAFEGVSLEIENVSGLVTAVSPYGEQSYGLIQGPAGSIRVPGPIKLFERIDGIYRDSKANVPLKEFKLFLDSKPKEYTIDALLTFVRAKSP